MPVTGNLALDQYKRAARFKNENEIGKPNYYKVKLDNQITVEMSPTERGAHIRFSFPKKSDSYIILDGYTGTSMVKIFPEENKIIGYVRNGRGVKENFRNYFVIQFDKPIKDFGTWENEKGEKFKGEMESEGRGAGAFI